MIHISSPSYCGIKLYFFLAMPIAHFNSMLFPKSNIEVCWVGNMFGYYIFYKVQVLTNLLSNAIKFTERGVISITWKRVECCTRPPEDPENPEMGDTEVGAFILPCYIQVEIIG